MARKPLTCMAAGVLALLLECVLPGMAKATGSCTLRLVVLGMAQDAGKPQIGVDDDPAWQNPAQRRLATALGLVNGASGARYLFDATPDIKAQLHALDKLNGGTGYRLDGVFLTHAHIGHYLGLAQFGREAMGARALPVYAMPKMASFLRTNGPWNQLVRLHNITLMPLQADQPVRLDQQLQVTPFIVPHRDEYSETAGFRIKGPGKAVIYLPDIDSWRQWDAMDTRIEDVVAANDVLFVDGTFYSGDELPGRDMSKIPHPSITRTMARLAGLPRAERAKVHFVHLNHTNPAHDVHSQAYAAILKAGFSVARSGMAVCLD